MRTRRMIAVRRGLWVVLALVVLQYAVGAVVFLTTPDDELAGPADAVVVLAGANSRLPVALRLIEDGAAPELLVSDDTPSEDEARMRFCAEADHPYPVTCRRPEPFSTRGEARMTAELARERGWREVVLVTSRFHLFRAERLFRRCTDAALVLRGASEPWYAHVLAIPSEWIKLLLAETVRRGC